MSHPISMKLDPFICRYFVVRPFKGGLSDKEINNNMRHARFSFYDINIYHFIQAIV